MSENEAEVIYTKKFNSFTVLKLLFVSLVKEPINADIEFGYSLL